VYGGADGLGEAFGGAAYVYRAVHPERVGASRLSSFLGWGSQTPCARCPVFDFCKQGGPVNPTDCVYYGEWFDKGVVQIE
jgi:DNA-directed RNA polymerase III subunit RPC6